MSGEIGSARNLEDRDSTDQDSIPMSRCGIADAAIKDLRLRRHSGWYTCIAHVSKEGPGKRRHVIIGTGSTSEEAFAAFGRELCTRLCIHLREDISL